MQEQRNVGDPGDDKHEQGERKHKDSEGRRHREGGGDEVAIEVLADIPPIPIVLLREEERVQGQRVDTLTRAVSEEQPLPACVTGELPAHLWLDDTYS